MTRSPSILVAALLLSVACTEPSFSGTAPDSPLRDQDAAAPDGAASLVDAGRRMQPVAPAAPDAGRPKPAMATPAVISGFRTGGQPRSADTLTLREDGFDMGDTLCVDKLCATGRFEP